MKNWSACLTVLCLGCGDLAREPLLGDPGADPSVSDPLSLGDCLAGGGALEVVWAVDNGHGAVDAMTLGRQGRTALAGEDGVIKYWVLSGEEPEHAGAVSNFNPGGMYGAEFQLLAEVTAMAYHPQGTLWLGRVDGQVCRLEEDSFTPLFAAALEGLPVDGVAPIAEGRALVSSREGFASLFLVDLASGQRPLQTGLWAVEDVLPGATPSQTLVVGAWYGMAAFEPWTGGASGDPEPQHTWVSTYTGTVASAVAVDDQTFFVGGRAELAAGIGGFVQRVSLTGGVESVDFSREVDSPVRELLLDAAVGVVLALTEDERLIGWSADGGDELFSIDLPMTDIGWGPVAGQLVGAGAHGRLVVYRCE